MLSACLDLDEASGDEALTTAVAAATAALADRKAALQAAQAKAAAATEVCCFVPCFLLSPLFFLFCLNHENDMATRAYFLP